MLRTVFVTGTDTGVGKTYVTCAIAQGLQAMNIATGIYKPVCSGAGIGRDGLYWLDIESAFTALRGRYPREQICPQRFLAPLAPPVAARMEQRQVNEDLIFSGLQRWHSQLTGTDKACLLVEGAGGWLSPIADNLSLSDLAHSVPAVVIVVAAQKLGVINHTLLTLESIRSRGLNVAGLIVNSPDADGDLSCSSNASEIRRLTDVPRSILLEHGETLSPAACAELVQF